jgi:hypothetical protein
VKNKVQCQQVLYPFDHFIGQSEGAVVAVALQWRNSSFEVITVYFHYKLFAFLQPPSIVNI